MKYLVGTPRASRDHNRGEKKGSVYDERVWVAIRGDNGMGKKEVRDNPGLTNTKAQKLPLKHLFD